MSNRIKNLTFHQFRHHVLDEVPEEFATEQLMLTAGRLTYGKEALWKLFNLTPCDIITNGIRIRCRTLVEGVIDSMAATAAANTRQLLDRLSTPASNAHLTVYDLFCGSGNLSFHFLRELRCTLLASEMDPSVYSAVEENFGRLQLLPNADLKISNCSYQQLLERRSPAIGPEIYIVDPPFGDAFSERGLDFTKTKPDLPQILKDISPTTRGSLCWIILKGTDGVVQPAFDTIWGNAKLLIKVYTEPKLDFGKNTVFYFYSFSKD